VRTHSESNNSGLRISPAIYSIESAHFDTQRLVGIRVLKRKARCDRVHLRHVRLREASSDSIVR